MKQNLIVFVKYPKKGKVKTRLAKGIGDEKAVEFYRNCILDIVEKHKEGEHKFTIFYSPKLAKGKFKKWLGDDVGYLSQGIGDLGKRMSKAFIKSFKNGYDSVVLMGSDIPQLSKKDIESAFKELETKDAVIGPSKDGGYYLIGFNKDVFSEFFFEGIQWSTHEVFDKTVNKFRSRGLDYGVLSECLDIDTIVDLEFFFAEYQSGEIENSRVVKFIKEEIKEI